MSGLPDAKQHLSNDLAGCRSILELPWQEQLARAIRDTESLARLLRIPADIAATASATEFPLLVPHSYLLRMQQGDVDDPLLKQVLPSAAEAQVTEGFSTDPVGDQRAAKAPGLLQKYHGRVLLITTGTCAVHCRYCFRRSFPYEQVPRRPQDWRPAVEQIRSDTTVTEVILSGGDPLVLSDRRLQLLFQQLHEIPHLERIRLHTRLPVVLPARITRRLLNLLAHGRQQVILVVHANHAREIAADCRDALQQLVRAGIPVLNQAVLLRGVNDSVDALTDLSTRLVNIGVMPYYLHQLDRVQGAAHFEVSAERGLQLVEAMRKRLPGYAVPEFVQEIAGAASKTPVAHLSDLLMPESHVTETAASRSCE